MPMYTLEKFECEGEISSVSVRWERWKRGLYIYLEAAGIDSESKKRASLLHFGGPELQEIYYNILGADISEGDLFKVAIQKLDEYFAPKQSKVYERHLFRLLKQESDEKFEKFLIRLRQQAKKCKFEKEDEHIIDQVTEKCKSDELRKKILKTGDSITLSDIIAEANALEAIDRQLSNFGNRMPNTQTVNKIQSEPWKEKQKRNMEFCTRCGSPKHTARDQKCPARSKSCLKCGIIGHFRKHCRTRQPEKRKHDIEGFKSNEAKKKKTVNNIEETERVNGDGQNIEYIFNIGDDSKLTCKIGGAEVEMLVDSGCKHNLITDQTWRMIKQNNAQIKNENSNPDKLFVAYGSDKPLKLLGSFQADIKLANK